MGTRTDINPGTLTADMVATYAEVRKADRTGQIMESGNARFIDMELRELRQAWANLMNRKPHGLPNSLAGRVVDYHYRTAFTEPG